MFLLTSQTSSTQSSEPDTSAAQTGPMTKPGRLKTGLHFILTVLFYSVLKNYLIFKIQFSNILTKFYTPWVNNTFTNLVVNLPN